MNLNYRMVGSRLKNWDAQFCTYIEHPAHINAGCLSYETCRHKANMDSIPFLQFTQLTFLPYVFKNPKIGISIVR